LSESKFQSKAMQTWRDEGAEVQKFTDLLQGGIADTVVGWKGGGFWCELKWVDIPARAKTPLMTADKFRPGQIPWLMRWWGKPIPTCVLVGSARGWIVVPGPKVKDLLTKPHTDWIWMDSKPSIAMIMISLRCLTK